MLPQLHAYYIARGIFGAMIVVSGIVQIVNIGMTIFTNTIERRRRETLRVAEAIAPPVAGMSRWTSDERRRTRTTPRIPRGWARHPRERMLITPLVAGLGGLVAFFVVVCVVVWLPIHTFDPPPSADWAPLSNRPSRDATCSRRTTATSATPATRGRRTSARRSTSSIPKVSQPGDFYGSDQSPEPARHRAHRARTCRRSRAGIPDDWQCAHFYDPRFVDPLSLMPPMKSLFSDKQVEQLTTFVETRSGKSGLLRYAGQLYAKHIVTTNQGFPPPYRGFQGAHKPIARGKGGHPAAPKGQLEEAPNLAQIDRSYWLSGNPLPVTEQNLMRGKEVFLQRCVGLPRRRGRRQGPGRAVHVAAARRLHRQGRRLLRRRHRAGRLLLPHPARLAGHRRWRTSATACPSTTSGASSCSSRRSRTTR